MIMQRHPSFQSTMSSAAVDDTEEDDRKVSPRPVIEFSSGTSLAATNRTTQSLLGQETNLNQIMYSQRPIRGSSLPPLPSALSHSTNANSLALPLPIRQDGMLQVVDEVSAFTDCRLLNDRDLILDCLGPLLQKRSRDSSTDEEGESYSQPAKKKPFQISQLRTSDPSIHEKLNNNSLIVDDGEADSEESDMKVSAEAVFSATTVSSSATNLDGIYDTLSVDSASEDEDEHLQRPPGSGKTSPNKRSNLRSKEPSPPKSSLELTEYQTNLWESRFNELREYRESHGNCLVPHNWSDNLALAKWVKRQRYQYKLKNDGKHSTLTEERRKALDDLGFIWDSHNAVWEERFGELLEFKRIHGHCNVPSTYSDNHSLSVWVQCQRRHYKQFIENREGNTRPRMSEERVKRLESIGFIWKPRIGRNDETEKIKKIK